MVKEFDVVIIGSGPAGCSTALNIHRLTPELVSRTLVLEKAVHPRQKVCGGGIFNQAENFLKEFGIRVDIPAVAVSTLRLQYGEETVDLPEGFIRRVVRRELFDQALAREVKDRGFTFHEGEKVTSVRRRGDQVVVTTEKDSYMTKVVVGADGVDTVLRKVEGFIHGEPAARLLVIETPEDEKTTREFVEKVGLVDLSYISKGLKGYIWDVPSYINGKPTMNRGIMDSNLEREDRVPLKEIFRDSLRKKNIDLDKFELKGHPERPFAPDDVFSLPNMLLVGDAAGIDPCFGVGIDQSFEYGRMAAAEIAEGLKSGDLSFAHYKKRILSSRMGKELVSYVALKKLFYGEDYEFWLSFLWNNRMIRKLLSDSYAGNDSFHTRRLKLFFMVAVHRFFGNKTLPRLSEVAQTA